MYWRHKASADSKAERSPDQAIPPSSLSRSILPQDKENMRAKQKAEQPLMYPDTPQALSQKRKNVEFAIALKCKKLGIFECIIVSSRLDGVYDI